MEYNTDTYITSEDETNTSIENKTIYYKDEEYYFPFFEPVQFSDLTNWVENQQNQNGRYIIPSYKQLRNLFEIDQEAGSGYLKNNVRYIAKMNSDFDIIGSASWFWVSDENSTGRCCINMYTGGLIQCEEIPSYPINALLIWENE